MVQADQEIGDYLGGVCELRCSDDKPNSRLAYDIQEQGINVSVNTPGLKDGGLRGPFLMAAAYIRPSTETRQPEQQQAPAYKATHNNLV